MKDPSAISDNYPKNQRIIHDRQKFATFLLTKWKEDNTPKNPIYRAAMEYIDAISKLGNYFCVYDHPDSDVAAVLGKYGLLE